jgi:hypothetical protein
MSRHPTTDRGWAGYAARMFKTIKPYARGGYGLSDNHRFETPFEGGYPEAPADAENVVQHLRVMVQTDLTLARAVVLHDECDRSGIVGLADIARTAIAKATGNTN